TWVAKGRGRTAEGFDLDPEPLAWGRDHNLGPLGRAARRVILHRQEVRTPGHRPADLRIAQNFSYMVFHERRELLDYFRAARADLARDGIFALDHYGGLEATEEMHEERSCGDFTYVWDQRLYLPGTGEYRCSIHFRFRDGSQLRHAFRYDWRYWSLPELRDLL